MEFSEKERTTLDTRYKQIRARLDVLRDDPDCILVRGEDPYIWGRLQTLVAMTPDELMAEIEADYVLFGGCYRYD